MNGDRAVDRCIGLPEPEHAADHLAILDVLYAYADAIDGRDWALARQLFTPDAHLDYRGSNGPAGDADEVLGWIADMLGALGHSQHLLANPRVRVTGDLAFTVCQLFNPLALEKASTDEPGRPVAAILLGGRYVDRLRRTAEGWRIEHRVQAADWQAGVSVGLLPGADTVRPHPDPPAEG